MPKFRQNGVIGIRVKWTLENEENWAMTHRFAGKCLMIAGCCCILFAFLPLGMAGDLLYGSDSDSCADTLYLLLEIL